MVHNLIDILDLPFLIVGTFIVTGYVASLILKRLGVPHIVTYLFTGVVLVNTLFVHTSFREDYDDLFHIIEMLALGLIGFKIGTELKIKGYSEQKNLVKVLLGEAFGAFLIVFSLIFLFTQNFLMAIILGGLATATDPAATTEIIRKLKGQGPLTSRVKWLLAFDDVVAIFIVEGILVYINVSLHGHLDILSYIIGIGQEIGIALVLGLSIGYFLDIIVEQMHDDLEMMELTFAVLIFAMGLASLFETSTILTTMVIGATVTNRKGANYEKVGDLLEVIMSPIIAMFFILVGASVLFSDFTHFPLLVLVYLIGRSTGKILGAYYGATITKMEASTRNNLGLGLLAQGGLVLGLVEFINDLLIQGGEKYAYGHEIVTIIVLSTILSEILGSYGAQAAIKRAGEAQLPQMEPETISEEEEHKRELHPLI